MGRHLGANVMNRGTSLFEALLFGGALRTQTQLIATHHEHGSGGNVGDDGGQRGSA